MLHQHWHRHLAHIALAGITVASLSTAAMGQVGQQPQIGQPQIPTALQLPPNTLPPSRFNPCTGVTTTSTGFYSPTGAGGRGGRGGQGPAPHPGNAIPDTVAQYFSSIGWCNWYIPEFHDVQRFIDPSGAYGPIAYAFAPPYLVQFSTSTPFTAAFVAVAIVYVDAPRGTALSAPYTQLGLTAGFNCVYLSLAGTVWSGKTTVSPSSGCANVLPAGTVGTTLRAFSETPGGTNSDSYPAVTRYSETTDSYITIGAKCGAAWCLLGTDVPAKILPMAYAGMPGVGTSVAWKVKGWNDDQRLAIPATGPTPPIQGRFHASIIPDDKLATYTEAVNYRTGWTHVATVMMPTNAPAKYRDGWGFLKGRNEVFIRAIDSKDWLALIVDPLGKPHYRHVVRTKHTYQGRIPATVRWAWSDDDEPIWGYCDGACCYIEGDGK